MVKVFCFVILVVVVAAADVAFGAVNNIIALG